LLVIELLLNAPRYLAPILTAGFVAAILILPFFLDVKPAAGAPSFFAFQTRPFVPITSLFHFLEIRSQLVWNLGYLLALPLGYLAEFGVFFLGGLWWLYARRQHPAELTYRDHMILGLGAISLILPSFVWSGMEISNDLGYRGILPAQLLLLLCTAECIDRYRQQPSPGARSHLDMKSGHLRRLIVAFLAIGIATNLLEMIILRWGIGTTAEHTIQVGEMFRPDTSAEHLYALRDAYTWIRKNTPSSSVVQESPATWQAVLLGQYAQRRTAVYGSNPSYMVGDDHQQYLAVTSELRALFTDESYALTAKRVCGRFKVNYLVVQSGDGTLGPSKNGGLASTPLFETDRVRVVTCEFIVASRQ
jgi:hypothetical protein